MLSRSGVIASTFAGSVHGMLRFRRRRFRDPCVVLLALFVHSIVRLSYDACVVLRVMVRCAQSSSRMPPSHVGTTACLIVLGWVLVRSRLHLRPAWSLGCTLLQNVA